MAEMLLWTNSRATLVLWGDFSVKSNLESAKDFFQIPRMPTKSCCWLWCCAFRIVFCQVKVIHLQWSTWMPAIYSLQGFRGPGEESREHALHTTCETKKKKEKTLPKKWEGKHFAGDCWVPENRVFKQFPTKLCQIFMSLVILKFLQSPSQFYTQT